MSYSDLTRCFERQAILGEARGVLGWDMQTYMPQGGGPARSRQIAELDALASELMADSRLDDWFEEAEQEELGEMERANLREMRRSWTHDRAVSPELSRALSEAGSQCFLVWKDARAENDFARLLPAFERVLELTREVAAARGEALGLSPYDALLDGFTPDLRAARIEEVFAPLRARLPSLLDEVLEHQASLPAPVAIPGPFPAAVQEELGKRLMAVIGFDFTHGRLDVSHHPFCGGVPSDVRITTRYSSDEFLSGLMGVLHETGHAMYERQLPTAWASQPVGRARGMAMHESQSLLVEMQVCRSPEFVRFAAPLIREAFGGQGPAWEPDNLLRHYHRVERGLIRVDADEVSYPLHVVLRFDLERKLLSGELSARDLPEAWRAGMKELVGVEPPDDRDGCMQDIHWMDGAYGYFPAYTLGAIAANQLYDAAAKALPGLGERIAEGDVKPLMAWLKEHVHGRASFVTSQQLLEDATGRDFDAEAYLGHLRRRYLS